MMINESLPKEIVLPDYKNSILNLSCSILKHYGIPSEHPTLPYADSLLAKNYPHVVVILLDGLGMNILEKYLHPRDFLRRHLITNYSSVFPPTTTASTVSFLSSKSPIEHGWLGWDVYFEQEDKTVTCFHNTLQGTQKPAASYNIPNKYLPYENIVEKINKSQKAKAKLIFPFGPEAHPDLLDWGNGIINSCKTDEKTFTYAYWENPDSILHRYGTNSNEVAKIVSELNAAVANICARCPDTLFFITADHGHIDVRNEYFTIDHPEIAKMLKKEPSIEPRAISFYVKDEFKEEFSKVFRGKFLHHYQLFSKEEVLNMELFGPGNKNANLTGIGDFIAAAFDHKTLYWDKNTKDFKSHHAGLSGEEMQIPLIAFQNKKRHTFLFIWYGLIFAILAFLYIAIF